MKNPEQSNQKICSTSDYVHVNLDSMGKGIQSAKTKFVPIVDETPPPSSAIRGRGAS
jgi:hypothetical protein